MNMAAWQPSKHSLNADINCAKPVVNSSDEMTLTSELRDISISQSG
jgi:hypothetical protein